METVAEPPYASGMRLLLAAGIVALCACGGQEGAAGGAPQSTLASPVTQAEREQVPPATPALAGHVLRRIGFGPTPALLDQLGHDGTDAYIEAQLQPDAIDESTNVQMWQLLTQIAQPHSELEQPLIDALVRAQLVRAVYSRRQLLEQLTSFWESHFNTCYYKSLGFADAPAATWFEWRENDLFRASALRTFRELLLVSATSPAMLINLDSTTNVLGAPNENYARELMELHTLGVDQLYTQQDVAQVARCFTGWTVSRVAPGSTNDPLAAQSNAPGALWAFHFDAALHDPGPKTIFAGTPHALHIPARAGDLGLSDGFDVLERLAQLPQTADFVCRKLIVKFVADVPPPGLLAECRATWASTNGSIERVLRRILRSTEFKSPSQRWNKVETPLESLCSTVRALDGHVAQLSQFTLLNFYLDDALDQSLFRWLDPDGHPEIGAEQLGTAKLLERIIFHQRFAIDTMFDVDFDIPALLAARGVDLDDPAAIVDELLRLLVQENFTPQDRANAIAFLSTDLALQPAALVPLAPDYSQRVTLCATLLASLPQAFQQ